MAATATGLCEFIDASPSPFHTCLTVAERLRAAGYTELAEADRWPGAPGRYFTVRAGSLMAWDAAGATDPAAPFRIVGAHTDSPNLRVKQHPAREVAGWQLVALAPYGGAWLNSWLDRDLGVSGRLSLRDGTHHLVRIDEPILRVPQLAIHLADDRAAVKLDPQRHVNAVWGDGRSPDFLGYVAGRAGVEPRDVLGFDLMTHDLAPSAVTGLGRDFVSAPRLDNQASCYAALAALVATATTTRSRYLPVLVLFDHEEVGSTSDHGAQSDLLLTVLERITLAAGGDREDLLRRLAGSTLASADMAHATHPNYPDRHEPGHQIAVNAGPVLKVQPNLRYATDGRTAATFAQACDQAGVALQRYEHRADLPCGSTIGPMSAARTGIPTVDVGAPQLAMHSARELMGARDVAAYAAALAAFLAPD
ncbi:M18 family aminopeptidase [Mycolicibacter algericus]|uniref:Probable M18 family aminopeptidase 2 n=2 Tax=Mycolicibacter algericus TaxID=1288388 RepID=A0A7I9YDS0_MYCAL|nr:M18 family aminopeptidase [Mycolicibacter algericus]OQZ97266.1 M18 family aminopeptidase [Mycolicibacter algericus DSM 45454]GFG86672.1 putative M18 family aminopeptidase 2 [Mycolicibacter algericus]